MSSAERRSFFRIPSEIVLDFHPVDSYTLENTRAEDEFPEEQKALSLFSELRRLDKEASPHLGAIGDNNRPLADYLKMLNKKLDLIAQQCVAANYSGEDVRPTHVNLSEGGIAFNSGKALYKDSHLALRIMFLSDYSSLASFARVVRCESQQESKVFKIACKFLTLNNNQQELLGRHIMQAQLEAKRRSQHQS
ncbi:PilZ domain-containing protein [Pseudomaricurvus alcaniphilus]|uniref:PilZ domain-containing protein n=1 Tax=Pseudomaricurvus alcaniphilus TaxID=1166482 RepID=UPI001407668B|nr:PilZ domain-containing protein [Pseudomaricurvus alcaniphilus]NHN35947.1 PilZ domain-containing protein [Pseudomaricurvus alcaniphilus]